MTPDLAGATTPIAPENERTDPATATCGETGREMSPSWLNKIQHPSLTGTHSEKQYTESQERRSLQESRQSARINSLMGSYHSEFAPINPKGSLCSLFNDRDLIQRCLDIRDPNNAGEQAAFQELKKLYRETYQYRDDQEFPDAVDQLLHVSNTPKLRTRCTFNEEMVPGFICITLHQAVYEFLRSEHADLLETMEPVMRSDESVGKSYIDETAVREFLDTNREALSHFEPQLIALYFGSFAFLHEHTTRENEILDPLLDWGEPYLEYFAATKTPGENQD